MRKISKLAAKKLVQNSNRRIREANKKFEALTPSEKRVAIARDVLAQIHLKRLVPTAGVWLDAAHWRGLFTKNQVKKDAELRDILKGTKQCEGCALGGMFMCAVERADKLKLSELESGVMYNQEVENAKENGDTIDHITLDDSAISESDAFTYLGRFFSRAQLDLIESCFELNCGTSYTDVGDDFCPDEGDASERMRLVMENIVVNKGRFMPEKQPVCHWTTPGFVA